VAGFAAHQDAAHGTNIADAGLAPATDFLGRREVTQVWTMAFARVHDLQSSSAPRGQQPAIWLDSAAQLRDIIAKHCAKTTSFQEITLHIDDQ
jgi:hypothetical protein